MRQESPRDGQKITDRVLSSMDDQKIQPNLLRNLIIGAHMVGRYEPLGIRSTWS